MDYPNKAALAALKQEINTQSQYQREERAEMRKQQSLVANHQAKTPSLWDLRGMSPEGRHPHYLAMCRAGQLQADINDRSAYIRALIYIQRKLKGLTSLDPMGDTYEKHKAANSAEYLYGFSAFKSAEYFYIKPKRNTT